MTSDASSNLSLSQAKTLVKTFMDTFRWEQTYYHSNRRDQVGIPVGPKRYHRYENGVRVNYSESQFKEKVQDYAASLGYSI